MSCDGNWSKFCHKMGREAAIAAAFPDAATALEEIHEVARQQAPKAGTNPLMERMAEARTVALFHFMQASGITPPSHSTRVVSGVRIPKHDAMMAYAVVWDTIQAALEGRELPLVAQQVRDHQVAARDAQTLTRGTPRAAPEGRTAEQELAREAVSGLEVSVLNYANHAAYDPDALHQAAKQVAAQSQLPQPLRRRAMSVVREFSTHGTLKEPERRKLGASFAGEVAAAMGADQCSRCGRFMADDGGHPCPVQNLLGDEAMQMCLGFWMDGQIDPLDEEQRRRVKLAARALAESPGASRELRHYAQLLAARASNPDADHDQMRGFARALFAVEAAARQRERAAVATPEAEGASDASASTPAQLLDALDIPADQRAALLPRIEAFQSAGGDLGGIPVLARGIEARDRGLVPPATASQWALAEALEWGSSTRLLHVASGQEGNVEEVGRAARTVVAMAGAAALGVRPGPEHCQDCGQFMPREGTHVCNDVDKAALPRIAGAVAECRALLMALDEPLVGFPDHDLRAQARWLYQRIFPLMGPQAMLENPSTLALVQAVELSLPEPVRVAAVAGNLDALLAGASPTEAQRALLRSAAQALADAPTGQVAVELKRAARRYLSGVHHSDFVPPLYSLTSSLRDPEALEWARIDAGLLRAEASAGLEATSLVRPGRVTGAYQLTPGQTVWVRRDDGSWEATTVTDRDLRPDGAGALTTVIMLDGDRTVPFDPERLRLTDPTNPLAAPPPAPSSYTDQAPHGLPAGATRDIYARFGTVLRTVYDADTRPWDDPSDADLLGLRATAQALVDGAANSPAELLSGRYNAMLRVAHAYLSGYRDGARWSPETQRLLGVALAEEIMGGLGLRPGPDHCPRCGQFLPREGVGGHVCRASDIEDLARLQEAAARGRAFLLAQQPEPLPAIADDRLLSGDVREQVMGLLDYVVDSYEGSDPAQLDPLRRSLEDALDPQAGRVREAMAVAATGAIDPGSDEMRTLLDLARSAQDDPQANDEFGLYRRLLGAYGAYRDALNEYREADEDDDLSEILAARETFLRLAAATVARVSGERGVWAPSPDETVEIVARWLASGSVGPVEVALASGVVSSHLGANMPIREANMRLVGALALAGLQESDDGGLDPERDADAMEEVFEAMRGVIAEAPSGEVQPPDHRPRYEAARAALPRLTSDVLYGNPYELAQSPDTIEELAAQLVTILNAFGPDRAWRAPAFDEFEGLLAAMPSLWEMDIAQRREVIVPLAQAAANALLEHAGAERCQLCGRFMDADGSHGDCPVVAGRNQGWPVLERLAARPGVGVSRADWGEFYELMENVARGDLAGVRERPPLLDAARRVLSSFPAGQVPETLPDAVSLIAEQFLGRDPLEQPEALASRLWAVPMMVDGDLEEEARRLASLAEVYPLQAAAEAAALRATAVAQGLDTEGFEERLAGVFSPAVEERGEGLGRRWLGQIGQEATAAAAAARQAILDDDPYADVPLTAVPPREDAEGPAGLISMEESAELQSSLRNILEGSGAADEAAFEAAIDRIRDRLPDEADAYGAFDRLAGAMREVRTQAIRDGLGDGLDVTDYTDTLASLINAVEGVPALARAVRGEAAPGDAEAIQRVAAAVRGETTFGLFDETTQRAASGLEIAVTRDLRPSDQSAARFFREQFARQMAEAGGGTPWQSSKEEAALAVAGWLRDDPGDVRRITAAWWLLQDRLVGSDKPRGSAALMTALNQTLDEIAEGQGRAEATVGFEAIRESAQAVLDGNGPIWPNRLPRYAPAEASIAARAPDLLSQLNDGLVPARINDQVDVMLQEAQRNGAGQPQVLALLGGAAESLKVRKYHRAPMLALIAGHRACPRCGEFSGPQGHDCPARQMAALTTIGRGQALTSVEYDQLYRLASQIRRRAVVDLTDPTLAQAAEVYTGLTMRPQGSPLLWAEYRLAAAIATATSDVEPTPSAVARRAVTESPTVTSLTGGDFVRPDPEAQRAAVALQRAAHRLRAFPIRQEDQWALDGLLGELAATRGAAPPTPDVLARAQAVIARYAAL